MLMGFDRVLDPDAVTLIDRMTVPPTRDRVDLINNTVRRLKDAHIWPELEMMQVYAAHTSQAALLDWKRSAATASPVNSPTFTTDRGYTGDGTTSYIDTTLNDLTGQITQDNVSFGGHINSGSNAKLLWWSNNSSRLEANTSGGNRSRSSTTFTYTIPGSFLGMWTNNRSASNSAQGYLNGASLGTTTAASSAPTAVSLHTHRSSSGAFGNSRIAMVFAGGSLTETDHANLYAITLDYLTAIGAQ